jgi:hypothetical protein
MEEASFLKEARRQLYAFGKVHAYLAKFGA